MPFWGAIQCWQTYLAENIVATVKKTLTGIFDLVVRRPMLYIYVYGLGAVEMKVWCPSALKASQRVVIAIIT